jgi:hypothetical protein
MQAAAYKMHLVPRLGGESTVATSSCVPTARIINMAAVIDPAVSLMLNEDLRVYLPH